MGVIVLQQTGLGAHLNGNHPRQLQVVELLLKPGAQVGIVVIGLGVLLGAGLRGLLSELLQVVGAHILQPLLPGDDIHGQLFIIFGVQIIHLVEHGDVLHQGHLMVLQHLDNLVHVGLCLGIAGLHRLQLVLLFAEEAEDAALFLLVLAEVLQLHHQGGQGLAHLAQVLGAHVVQRALGKGGDVLLGRRAVLEHQV